MTSGGRRKILFVLPTLNLAGAQTVAVELVRGLDRDRYDVEVCCLLGLGHFEAELRERGVALHVLRPAGWKDVRLPVRLARLARARRVDLVCSHFHPFDLWACVGARLAGIPCVVTKHSTYDEDPFPGPVRTWIERATQRLATAYVGVSNSVAECMAAERGIDRRRIRVIYNGVDPTRFRADPETRAAAREELALPPGCRVVGTVANLRRRTKGYEVLLEAMPDIVRHFPDAHFLWIGGDADEFQAEIEARAGSLGVADHLHLAGRRSDVPRLLAAMDLFVLPSRREGLGIVLVEAMASGLPVVASAVGGIPEVVADGATGRLVPPGDPSALGEAIEQVLGDPERARAWGRAGRERAEATFSVARMVESYRELFESIVT